MHNVCNGPKECSTDHPIRVGPPKAAQRIGIDRQDANGKQVRHDQRRRRTCRRQNIVFVHFMGYRHDQRYVRHRSQPALRLTGNTDHTATKSAHDIDEPKHLYRFTAFADHYYNVVLADHTGIAMQSVYRVQATSGYAHAGQSRSKLLCYDAGLSETCRYHMVSRSEEFNGMTIALVYLIDHAQETLDLMSQGILRDRLYVC